MTLCRRHFLKSSVAAGVGFGGLRFWFERRGPGEARAEEIPLGYGPLLEDPRGILDLPERFTYQIISRAGERMADGFFVPSLPDGMAAFPGARGLTLLVRNHEVHSGADAGAGPFGRRNELARDLNESLVYDPGRSNGPCLGGTTTLVFDTRTQRLHSQFLSLVGTLHNCAGGPTPWSSWISCEECVQRADDDHLRDHGYAFEVPADERPGLQPPRRLTAMGRFYREAVAVDPRSGIVYQTEDVGDGLIYRFVPDRPRELAVGGRLQALAVAGGGAIDTRNWNGHTIEQGVSLPVEWIDLDEIDSPEDDLRYRGFDTGAARFARAEGMWWGRGSVYFACTNGGRARRGQIWRYVPGPWEGTPRESEEPGFLDLFVEADGKALIDRADNLTVSPWGDLILCEDGPDEQFLVGVDPGGGAYRFARNAGGSSGLAGATFSPDGTTMFVNIQHAGLTLSVTGPWRTM